MISPNFLDKFCSCLVYGWWDGGEDCFFKKNRDSFWKSLTISGRRFWPTGHKKFGQNVNISSKCKKENFSPFFEKFRKRIEQNSFSPSIVRRDCYAMIKQKRYHRNVLTTLMMWKEPNAAHTNCYACLVPNLVRKKFGDWKKKLYPERNKFWETKLGANRKGKVSTIWIVKFNSLLLPVAHKRQTKAWNFSM